MSDKALRTGGEEKFELYCEAELEGKEEKEEEEDEGEEEDAREIEGDGSSGCLLATMVMVFEAEQPMIAMGCVYLCFLSPKKDTFFAPSNSKILNLPL